MKTYIYVSLLSSVLVSGSVYAACTPAPDCASLGYTATSCPNGGVRCPWDTNLWHCDKDNCGEAYKYTCTGTGYTGGTGTACSNKYTSCNCSPEYAWKNGSCRKRSELSGWCCNDESIPQCSPSYYDYCKRNYGYISCSVMEASCISAGGSSAYNQCDYDNPDSESDGRVFLICTFFD